MKKPHLKNKQRLDVLLLELGLVSTRAKAQALIMAGKVKVDKDLVRKSGTLVSNTQKISLLEGPAFVSRGGEKLEGALADFNLSPLDQDCLDVGSSTGGFTDCLLKKGAKKVVAVDVGKGQLDISLRTHPRVDVKEKTHILVLNPEDLDPRPSFVTIDVSFISLKKVLPHIRELSAEGATFLVLVKPQFEVGPKVLKKGVVRSTLIQEKVVEEIREFATSNGFKDNGMYPCRLKGPKGNQEYFVWLTKE
ncbi:hypothetical protein BVX98_03620 [bacterium F11]|nr:hypothetical protein BVX98_03620 [bacterium F11]